METETARANCSSPLDAADPLGEALHLLQMSSVLYSRSEFTAPWGLELPPLKHRLMFHVVMVGRCWLEVEGHAPQVLQPGDFALVPHGEGHRLLSEPGGAAKHLHDVPSRMFSERYELLTQYGGGEPVSMICGVVRFEHPAAQQLINLLPEVIFTGTWRSAHQDWIQSTLRLMADEAKVLKPGGETVITRLADILVIQAIRHWIETDPAAQTGWLGALKDKRTGHALLLMQRQPEKAWTVETLASAVYMSRSAFAAKFKRQVGEPPLQYLTRWRMNLALAKLKAENVSLGALAEQLGYQSEAAFSRAFKRYTGVTPGKARRSGYVSA